MVINTNIQTRTPMPQGRTIVRTAIRCLLLPLAIAVLCLGCRTTQDGGGGLQAASQDTENKMAAAILRCQTMTPRIDIDRRDFDLVECDSVFEYGGRWVISKTRRTESGKIVVQMSNRAIADDYLQEAVNAAALRNGVDRR